MVTATSQDALLANRFAVDIDGVPMAYFQGVSGFSNESTLVDDPVAIGNGVTLVRKLPGQLRWEPCTLTRGVTTDMELWNWRKLVIDGETATMRKNVSIIMYDHNLQEKLRYNLMGAWPSKWSGPAVKSDDESVAVEELVIQYEDLQRVAV